MLLNAAHYTPNGQLRVDQSYLMVPGRRRFSGEIRVSKNQRSKLLKPVIDELVTSIPALQNLKDPHTVAAQVFHAAIGSISPERAGKHGLPISSSYPSHNWRYEYNFVSASERALRMLGLPRTDSDALAQRAIDLLTQQQIGMNRVHLMLDHRYNATRDEHFNHLLNALNVTPDRRFKRPPTTATMAIAKGELSPPDMSWKARFDLLSAFPWSRLEGGLLSTASKTNCYLWVFPPTKLEATASASMDRYDGLGSYDPKQASLGMGFSIITEPWQRKDHQTGKVHDQYRVYTPFWSYSERAKHQGYGNGWRLGNILDATIYEGYTWQPTLKLKHHLHGGVTSLPLLKACPECSTFYIPSHKSASPDMPSTCDCLD